MNEGGVLIVACDPDHPYSVDQTSYCGSSSLPSCSLAVVSVPANPSVISVLRVIAAFPDASTPSLAGVAFGLSYEAEKLSIVAFGSCADYEVPNGTWPASGTGTAVAWTDSIPSSHLVDVYWVAAYAYAPEDSTVVTLIPNPEMGGTFGDNGVPPVLDTIADYGRFGFGKDGYRPCPGAGTGPQGPGGDGPIGDGGTEPSGGEGDSEPPDSLATELLSMWIVPEAISLDHQSHDALPINQAEIVDSVLEHALLESGAIDIAVENPGLTPADTLGLDYNGDPVRTPDFSGFYRVRFESAAAAAAAVDSLYPLTSVRTCQVVHRTPVATVPTDPYVIDAWPQGCAGPLPIETCVYNPQWHLINQGLREGSGNCLHSTSGIDIDLTDCDSIPGQADIIIVELDTGVRDDHPDLNVIPLTEEEKHAMQNHPEDDWCYPHGTLMAGLAAAVRDNDEGVSGVCGHCRILDLASSPANCICGNSCAENIIFEPSHLNYAVSHFAHEEDDTQMVLNIEMAGRSDSTFHDGHTNDEVLALWSAYLQGVVQVAPSHDQTYSSPNWCGPGDLPFVLAVGGYNYNGKFWEPHTNCMGHGNGTTAGPFLEVCAPASPGMLSTSPNEAIPGHGLYELTDQCSAASAIAAGAIGELMQFNAIVCASPDGGPLPDDYRGLLTATAIPWEQDPRIGSDCTNCSSLDDFGPGRMNLAAAEGLLYDIWGASEGGDPPGGEVEALYRMKLVATDMHRFLKHTTDYGDNDNPPILRVYEYELPIVIPTVRENESARYAWPMPANSAIDYPGSNGECRTTAPLVYGDIHTPDGRESVWELATDPTHPTSCTMSVIDRATGVAYLRCYNLARVTKDEQGNDVSVEYVVPPAQLEMAYTVFSYLGFPRKDGHSVSIRSRLEGDRADVVEV